MENVEQSYRPRRLPYVWTSLLSFALAAIAAALTLRFGWGLLWLDRTVLGLAAVLACYAVGCALSAILGFPRLILTEEEVVLRRIWGSVSAAWDSIGLFDFVPAGVLYLHRPPVALAAPVTGPDASLLLRRAKRFVIPDVFTVPIEAIASDLNESESGADGEPWAPPASVTDHVRLGVGVVPWATLGLVVLLGAIFATETVLAASLPEGTRLPSPVALWALGGLNALDVLRNGAWYRLLAGPLLHGYPLQWAIDSVVILLAGSIVERIVGHAWLVSLFVIGTAAGALLALVMSPPLAITVGTAGGTMALLAAMLTLGMQGPAVPASRVLQGLSVAGAVAYLGVTYIAAQAGLSFSLPASQATRLAGMLAGGGLVYAMLDRSRAERLRPARLVLARVLAALSASAVLVSLGFAAAGFAANARVIAGLIPPEQVPASYADFAAHGADLAARYPGDPRAHYAFAHTLMRERDAAGAERALRMARQLLPSRQTLVGERFDPMITVFLSYTLLQQGRRAAAAQEARSLCPSAVFTTLTPQDQDFLTKERLCP
ncbi:MAG: rhomboid family intramembrane serine protease [Acetobacteraceae bacterium]|nr:rhomboid family intramembrane serine protease [Pseudomonadota bacterium]